MFVSVESDPGVSIWRFHMACQPMTDWFAGWADAPIGGGRRSWGFGFTCNRCAENSAYKGLKWFKRMILSGPRKS